MKRLFPGLFVLALLCFLSAPPQTQAQTSERLGPLAYDISKEVTLNGTVSSVLTKPAPGMMMGSHLLLATASGPVDASLGRFALQGKGALSVVAGQQIEITGVMKSIKDKQVFFGPHREGRRPGLRDPQPARNPGAAAGTGTCAERGVAMNRKTYASILALAFLAISFLTGCSSSNSSSTTPTIAIAATSGGGQSAQASAAFANPLVATVTSNGSPASGVTVTFSAPAQTGASGTFAGGTNTATTNASGVATSPAFTANGIAGTYTVTATTSGATTPASFSLTNTAAATTTITATSGTPQSATVSAAFANPLVATVTSNGSPASGVTVTFSAPAQTGASGTFAGGTNTATTNASGVATSPAFTANGIAGTYTVTATTSGATTPASFSLTNTAGAPATVTATSGSGQGALVNTQFANPLVATVVDSNSNPVSGMSVTFAAPASAATCTFATTPPAATDTETTNASGMATSQLFTASATTGGYTVTATVGSLTPANFTLANTVNTYAFYLSGLEVGPNSNGYYDNYYAVAGSVAIANGTVLGGELDYNDGDGNTSPGEPTTPDSISGGTLTTDGVTGQYTLTLNTSNTNLGVGGVITLGVQFVNGNHALIAQFDGSATSSGSLDLQTNGSIPSSTGFAFTLSGVDTSYFPVTYGGVFTTDTTGTTLSGVYDSYDGASGTPSTTAFPTGVEISGPPDGYGRGTVTGTNLGGNIITLAYYIVGPEAIRLIDVDPATATAWGAAAVGSAFGQGGTTFSNASLGPSVFGILDNPSNFAYAAVGSFTIPASGTFSGIGDDDEEGNVCINSVTSAPPCAIGGAYSVSNTFGGTAYNGYSNLAFTSPFLQDVNLLGIYLTDPKLNINDPNNSGGQQNATLAGALVVDLSGNGFFGTGVLIPQTDTAPGDFTGTASPTSYTFGVQDYNFVGATGWEFDSVGQGSFTSGSFAGTGLLNDVFGAFGTGTPDSGVTFTGAPAADTTPPESTTGRYTLSIFNTPQNPLVVTVVAGNPVPLDVVIYQASGTQLFWLNEDSDSWFLGPIEQQGTLTGVPALKKGSGKSAKPKQK